jgi:acyl-CoA reductase-like NAD-dependent aldehyde dehydrogenase
MEASAGAVDADLDEIVPAVLGPAFGFAGQKCPASSRLRAPA